MSYEVRKVFASLNKFVPTVYLAVRLQFEKVINAITPAIEVVVVLL
jgi:hypothetical protein